MLETIAWRTCYFVKRAPHFFTTFIFLQSLYATDDDTSTFVLPTPPQSLQTDTPVVVIVTEPSASQDTSIGDATDCNTDCVVNGECEFLQWFSCGYTRAT